jgi:hypothetical protein
MHSRGAFQACGVDSLADDPANVPRRDAPRARLDLIHERPRTLPHASFPHCSGVNVEAERLAEQIRSGSVLFPRHLVGSLQKRGRK